jgi:hypothetical protein
MRVKEYYTIPSPLFVKFFIRCCGTLVYTKQTKADRSVHNGPILQPWKECHPLAHKVSPSQSPLAKLILRKIKFISQIQSISSGILFWLFKKLWSVVWIPAGTKDLSLLKNFQTGSGDLPASYSVGTRVPSLGGKRPGCHTDHSPSNGAEFKNKWISTSTTPICLYCVYRIKCTSTTNYVRQHNQT